MSKKKTVSTQAIYLTIEQREAVMQLQERAKVQCGVFPSVHQITRHLLDTALTTVTAQARSAA